MLDRILLPAMLATSGAFACAASTKCVPDVYARQFTVVKGDVDAMLVQEYSLANGCSEVTIDSIVRRGVAPESLRINKNAWTSTPASPSAAVTVYGRWTSPKLDSAQAALCAKVRVERHVDSIPRSHVFYPGPCDLPVESIIAPVDSDSVYVCLNGNCSKITPRVVHNTLPLVDCMVGLIQPLATKDEALAFLREKIAASGKALVLERGVIFAAVAPPVVVCPLPVLPQPDFVTTAAARNASTIDIGVPIPSPSIAKETRFSIDQGWHNSLAPLRSWNDPIISKRLALPSSANAGDLVEPEILEFAVSDLQGSRPVETLRYATGVQRYQYRGSTYRVIACGLDPYTKTLVGDSLRLKGLNLVLSTQNSCSVDGQDIHASKYLRWLYLPSGAGSFQTNFTHTFQAENDFSWPIEADSVLVRGQKVALASLQAFVATLPRQIDNATLSARVVDGTLSVILGTPSTVRLSTPSGRILSSSARPAGISRIALPAHHHGLLLVDDGSRTVPVVAP